MPRSVRRLCAARDSAVLAVLFLFAAVPLLGSRAYEVRNLSERIHDAKGKVTVDSVPLENGDPATIELEPFELWALGAKVVVHDEHGVHEEDPPPRRFFKGRVIGKEDSVVFLSADPNDPRDLQGLILIAEKKFFLGRGVAHRAARERRVREREEPILISQVDPLDDFLDPSAAWTCQVDRKLISGKKIELPAEALSLKPAPDAGGVSGASYTLKLAVETDFELYSAFGSTSNVTNYITNLAGAASTIYQRDVNTTLTLGQVSVYSTSSDPYSATAADTGLAELSSVWHANYLAVQRSGVVMVSGKITNSGIAWVNNLCVAASNDFYCGDTGANCGSSTFAHAYAGSYAWCGSGGSVTTTVPDPNATVNGVQYALPNNANFWMLLEFVHELGHVVGEDHTQCTALTAGEKTQYSTTRNYVDECYNADGAGCFSGSSNFIGACFTSMGNPTSYCPAPPELGTIMSYCQNVFCPAGTTCAGSNTGTYRQSRYLFGKSGEASFKMLGIFTTRIDAVTPNGTITIGSAPLPCSAGQTASVASCSGCTYSWSISGGSITAGAGTTQITFTPTSSSVTVTVTITNANGCGITASVTRTTSCSSLAAPTGVTATPTGATTVQISWTAPSGASGSTVYEVHRSTNNSTFTQVCTATHPTVTCNDMIATGNTAYVYKVRAGSSGTFSAIDLATTTSFTNTIVAGGTVKAVDVTETRALIDKVRALTGLVGGSYSSITVQSTTIQKAHITEMRTALDAGRSALQAAGCSLCTALTYTDSTITTGSTLVKAAHFNDVRNGLN